MVAFSVSHTGKLIIVSDNMAKMARNSLKEEYKHFAVRESEQFDIVDSVTYIEWIKPEFPS